jgi:NTP pyrophosphatase (non-canonical NTP hydrolase)
VEFEALIQRALAVRGEFAAFEVASYGREWTTEELTLGLMKDVGDLAALVQASEGVRQAEDVDKAVGHEPSDCLWPVIVLADRLGADLEAAFTRAMDDLHDHLSRGPA